MSAIPLDMVRGEHNARAEIAEPLPISRTYIDIHQLINEIQEPVLQVNLKNVLGQPVYEVKTDGSVQLYDAVSGKILEPLTRAQVEQIAQNDFVGQNGGIRQTTLLKEHVAEARGRSLPLWLVEFDDVIHTRLYVSSTERKVVARRNDFWRVFDFVWMLHIMDYDERDDFNNPLLIFSATLALFLVLSGIVLVQRWWVMQSRRKRTLRKDA